MREILRPKILIAVAVVAFLFLTPSGASAQRVIPHAFLGLATINGFPAADGTVVAALVDGRQVVAKSVSGGSYPVLLVEPNNDSFVGKIVTFTIGGIPANETALWIQGEVTELNLSASPSPGTPTATPVPTATPDPLGSMFLDIEEPASVEVIVAEGTFTVVGRTRLDSVVSVNDTFAEVNEDGRFRVTLQLEEGPNIIDVIAKDSTGKQVVEILVIIYSP